MNSISLKGTQNDRNVKASPGRGRERYREKERVKIELTRHFSHGVIPKIPLVAHFRRHSRNCDKKR